jgi:hypothetical protein
MTMVKSGEPVRVWSGVLGEWLWWVKGEKEKQALAAQGIEAGIIYTLGELAVLAGWGGPLEDRKRDLRGLHAIKREFGGTVEQKPEQPPHVEQEAQEAILEREAIMLEAGVPSDTVDRLKPFFEAFYGHIMTGNCCHPQSGRFCGEGKRLKTAYDQAAARG